MLKALFYIFLFLIIGELVVYGLAIPVPGNIIGMLLIFFSLKTRIIKLSDVKPASDKIIKYLVLFFIPFGVGLMQYFDLIGEHWLPITIATVVSTVLTLIFTGFIQQKLEKK